MSAFLFFTFAVTAVVLLWQFYLKQLYRFWDVLKVPHTKPRFPFGEFQNYGWHKNLGILYDDIYRKFIKERFCGIWMFLSPILVVKDPEVIKAILVKDFSYFHDRGIYYNEKDDPLSAHMFAMDGEKWKNIRAKLSPTFTSAKMKMMLPLIKECGKEMKDHLLEAMKREQTFSVLDTMARYTTDVISLCAFGINTNSFKSPKAEFREMARRSIEPTMRNMIIFLLQTCFPNFLKFIRARVVHKDVADYFLKSLRETIEYREKNNVAKNDFLQLLIQLKNKGSLKEEGDSNGNAPGALGRMTFEEAAAEAFVFFLAGSETSSSTLQYLLYEIAQNEDVQSRLRSEIINSWKNHKSEFSYEFVQDIPYMDLAIDETLRKYPIVPTLVRECVKNYKIPESDVIIPKRTLVHIPIYSLHRDEKYYPEPDRFDPDRFSETERPKIHPYTYMPFGEGPRNCIGKRFGLMQVKVALVYLLCTFKFELAEEEKGPLTFSHLSFLLQPNKPVKLKIKLAEDGVSV